MLALSQKSALLVCLFIYLPIAQNFDVRAMCTHMLKTHMLNSGGFWFSNFFCLKIRHNL